MCNLLLKISGVNINDFGKRLSLFIFNWSCQCRVISKFVVFLLPMRSPSLHIACSFHIIQRPAEMHRTAFNLLFIANFIFALCQFSKEYRRGAEFICLKPLISASINGGIVFFQNNL